MFRKQNSTHVGLVTLAILLITGLAFVPALDVKVDAQNAKLAQIKNWVLKTSCSKLISPLAQVIAKSYPGVSTASITLLLQLLVKEATTNSGQAKACQDLKQIAYQILSNPHGIVATSLVIYIKQITSKKNTYEVVVKEIYKSGSGGSSGNSDCIGICQNIFINIHNYCERNADCKITINNIINNVNNQLVAVSGGKIDPNALRLAAIWTITQKAANSPTGNLATVTIQENESLNLLKNVNGNIVPAVPLSPSGPTPTELTATTLPISPNVNGATAPLVISGVSLPTPDGNTETIAPPSATEETIAPPSATEETIAPPSTLDDNSNVPDTTAPLVISGVSLPPPEDNSNVPDTSTSSTTTEEVEEEDSSALPSTTTEEVEEEDSSAQATSESEGDNDGIDFGDDGGDSGGDDGGDSGGDDGGDSGGAEE